LESKKVKIITAAAVIIVLLFGINLYRKSTRNVIDEIISKNGLINILIAGRNVYNENTFSFYAIVSINPSNNNIGITFIPPDYKIMMNDDGTKIKKISELDFYYFDRIKYSLKQDLQLHVPFYIKIYSSDVIRSVNMLDGLNLLLLDQPGLSLKEKFGVNYLDGKKIINYINSSEQNSIYLKYDRILDILMTLYSEREMFKKFQNEQFITEIFKNIKTNLMPQEIYSISKIIFEKGNVDSTLLPGGFNNGLYVVDEVSYRTYQQEFLTTLITDSDSDSNAKITILNGTNIPGLARKLRNDLIREGLNVVEFGTSGFPFQKDSMIVCRKCDIRAANKTAELAGINKIYFVTDTTQLSNVLIIVGEDMAGDKKTDEQ